MQLSGASLCMCVGGICGATVVFFVWGACRLLPLPRLGSASRSRVCKCAGWRGTWEAPLFLLLPPNILPPKTLFRPPPPLSPTTSGDVRGWLASLTSSIRLAILEISLIVAGPHSFCPWICERVSVCVEQNRMPRAQSVEPSAGQRQCESVGWWGTIT